MVESAILPKKPSKKLIKEALKDVVKIGATFFSGVLKLVPIDWPKQREKYKL